MRNHGAAGLRSGIADLLEPPCAIRRRIANMVTTTPRTRRIAALLACAVALSSCGTAPQVDPDNVALSGAIYTDFRTDQGCAEYTQPAQLPSALAEVVITFTDGAGSVVGSVVPGRLDRMDLARGCRFLAPYEIVLPRIDEYHVDFEAPDPDPGLVGYFDGANALQPQETTLAQLEADGLTWIFEAPPQFVVP